MSMPNLEQQVAFALFTADTGDASFPGWLAFKNKDKYERMARVAIRIVSVEFAIVCSASSGGG
jgi:hypothetical protein